MMSALKLALIRISWKSRTTKEESNDQRRMDEVTSWSRRIEVVKSFDGTDGKLRYWFDSTPVNQEKSILGQAREVVLREDLRLWVKPTEFIDPHEGDLVNQIKWGEDNPLRGELEGAQWNLPVHPGEDRVFLVEWHGLRAWPLEPRVYGAEGGIPLEFTVGEEWEWRPPSFIFPDPVVWGEGVLIPLSSEEDEDEEEEEGGDLSAAFEQAGL